MIFAGMLALVSINTLNLHSSSATQRQASCGGLCDSVCH